MQTKHTMLYDSVGIVLYVRERGKKGKKRERERIKREEISKIF